MCFFIILIIEFVLMEVLMQLKKHKKKKKLTLSVIMPVYNTKEEHLRAAIESILNQTYKKFEFIIVDDCSTKEDIEKIVSSYNDSRIRFVRQDKNQGDAVARNRGIEMAKGEFIAMQDSDDISRPERFAVQLQYMRKFPDVGVLGTAYNVFPGQKEKVWNKFGTAEYLNSYALFHNSPFGHSSVMIRSSVLKDLGVRYNKNYICNDFKLWMDLVGKTKFMNVPRVLLDYRWHGNNISIQKADVMNEQVAKIRTDAWIEKFKMNPNTQNLMIRFMKGESLKPIEQRKAFNILNQIFEKYEKEAGNPRADEMFNAFLGGISARVDQNSSSSQSLIFKNFENILDWRVENQNRICLQRMIKRKSRLNKIRERDS